MTRERFEPTFRAPRPHQDFVWRSDAIWKPHRAGDRGCRCCAGPRSDDADIMAVLLQCECRGQADDACANDGYLHVRSITRSAYDEEQLLPLRELCDRA